MSKKFLVVSLILLLGLFSLSFAQVTTQFKDVPPTHWAAKAVKYLTDLGIIAGIRPDTFGGDMYVTRYQVAVLLYNLIEKLKLTEVALPAKDIAELKSLVKELSEELTLLGSRVDELTAVLDELSGRVSDLETALEEKASLEDVNSIVEESLGDVVARLDDVEGRVGDLESQVADLASQIAGIEKVEVTEEQIKAVITEKLEETIEKVTKETMEELIGRVSDLEGLAGDLDSRLSDVEVALTEKTSVEDVQAMIDESLGDVVARLDDVESVVSDLDLRIGDVESAVNDVMAITDDLSANLISLSERVDALEGLGESVENLTSFVEDIEGRVSDLEVLLTDRPTMDEVTALLEEKLAEIQVPDVEELRASVEEHTDAIDALRADVDAILTEELPTMKDDIASLQDQVAEISDRLSQLEAGVKPEVVEVPAEIEELAGRIETVEASIEDLYSITDELTINLTELADKVSGVEETVSDVQAKVSDLEKAVGKFAVSGSTSVTVKKEFGANKNVAITQSTTVNLSFKPADGVNVSTKLYGEGAPGVDGKFYLNSFDVNIAQIEFGLKNLALSYVPGADSNFAVDVNGLVGSKTAKFVASVDLPGGLKASLGLDGTDGTGADLVAGKVSGSLSNIDINVFGMVGRTATNVAYSYTFGSDFGTSVAEGIKLFGEVVYDGTFDVLGGVSLSDVGVKGLSSTLKATYQDDKLTLYGSASYPVTPQATVSTELTVSDVTHTPSYTVKGAVSGTVAPFSYEAYFVYPSYETWAKVSGKVNPKTGVEVAFFAPNLTQFDLNKVSLVLKGTYSLTDKVTLWAWATNNQDGKWFTDQDMTTYPGTATAMAGVDYALTPNITLNLSVFKKGLGNIPKDPLPTDVTLKVSVGF